MKMYAFSIIGLAVVALIAGILVGCNSCKAKQATTKEALQKETERGKVIGYEEGLENGKKISLKTLMSDKNKYETQLSNEKKHFESILSNEKADFEVKVTNSYNNGLEKGTSDMKNEIISAIQINKNDKEKKKQKENWDNKN